jgi:hypothetical protein
MPMTIFGGNDPLTVSAEAPINATVVPARVLLLIEPAWRGDDMRADLFNDFCEKYGLLRMEQELINWPIAGRARIF